MAAAALRSILSDTGHPQKSLLTKVTPQVEAARAANKARGGRGSVAVGRVWRGQKKADIPRRAGFLPVYVSKGKGVIGNELSPFLLVVPDDMLAFATSDGAAASPPLPRPQKLETVWQGAKKYSHEDMASYFARRRRIYEKGVPKRRYEKGTIDGACFGGPSDALVGYKESRVFYCTAYERATAGTKSFRVLRRLADDGFNLLLLGPDGHPLPGDAAADFAAAYADVAKQFGHERALACLVARAPRPWAAERKCWLPQQKRAREERAGAGAGAGGGGRKRARKPAQ